MDPPDDRLRLVLAFDGDCLMCNRSIRFLATRDRHDRLRFTRLQDPLGREMAAAVEGGTPDSMLVRRGDTVLDRSEAVLAILAALGSPWRPLGTLARMIPRRLRDAAYDLVARHRHRWRGRVDACALADEALRRRML